MLIAQNQRRPAQIRNAIVDMIDDRLVGIEVAAAYTTKSGTDLLTDAIIGAVGCDRFSQMPKSLITSFDYGITKPEALEYWMSLENTDIQIAGVDAILQGKTRPGNAFHPKVYAFHIRDGTSSVLVASANLTGRGFTCNTEAGWIQKDASTSQIDASFQLFRAQTEPLTQDLIERYKQVRGGALPPGQEPIEALPVPAFDHGDQLRSLRDAVEKGLDFADYDALWVHVKSLSGGSNSQLELPRTGHRFFGFNFVNYDQSHKKIGEPTLRIGRRCWTDKRLTWHGNNRMERLNLPTQEEGGPPYADSAIMFRRLPDKSFELIVTPRCSDLANAWGEASARTGNLYRLGTQSTDRLVGLVQYTDRQLDRH